MVFNNGTSAFFQLLNQGNAGISINRNRSERSSGILGIKLAAHEVMDTSYTTHRMEKKNRKSSFSHALEHPIAPSKSCMQRFEPFAKPLKKNKSLIARRVKIRKESTLPIRIHTLRSENLFGVKTCFCACVMHKCIG